MADVRALLHRLLSDRDAATHVHLTSSASDTQGGDDALTTLKALWTETQGFKARKTRHLRQMLGETTELDPVTRLMVDDYVLDVAGRIHPEFRRLMRSDAVIPESLPLADNLLARIERVERRRPRFDKTILIACQHLMGTTVTELSYLHAMGIAWEDMHIIGKPYSTSRLAVLALRDLNANVSDFSLYFPKAGAKGFGWYDAEMNQAIDEIIAVVGEKLRPGWRVLVLDDGGMVINALASKHGLDTSKVKAVEQTTGGLRRVESSRPEFPVINIADANAKLAQEAQMIAESIVLEVRARLRRIRGSDTLRQEQILVIGYGAVGAWLATMLRHADVGTISIFDLDNRKTATAVANGYQGVFRLADALRGSSLIIGCTGTRAFPQHIDKYLPHDAILASASSNNIEFDGMVATRARTRYMHSRANPFVQIARAPFTRLHDDYQAEVGSRQFWIANAGFPVNFTGALDPIPPESIQITRALMLAGAVDAIETDGRGLHRFRTEYDHCVREAFQRIVDSRPVAVRVTPGIQSGADAGSGRPRTTVIRRPRIWQR